METCYNGWNGLEGEGAQYGYWNGKVAQNYSSNACLKKYRPGYTSADYWWERSVIPDSWAGFALVGGNGDPSGSNGASITNGVCPCFSMGEPDPEYWIEREDGSIMKPAQINAAAKSIADEGTASPYYAEFKNFMDNGGDWDTAANAPGATFGQALEDGFGLMHIKWGDGREYTARIVGMNHDDKSDGTGKAGLTWQFTGLLYNYYAMHGKNSHSTDYNTTNGGWRDTILRKWMNPDDLTEGTSIMDGETDDNRVWNNVPASPDYNTTNGGWRDTILRKWMNPDDLTEGTSIMDGETDDNRVWNNVPASLQNSIVAVDKLTKNRDDGTATNADLKNIAATATSDRLWIMSYPEIVETCYNGWNGLEGEGAQYGYWNGKVAQNNSSNACLKKYRPGYTSTGYWWERSVSPNYATSFAYVNNTGDPGYVNYASSTSYVCPCFCL